MNTYEIYSLASGPRYPLGYVNSRTLAAALKKFCNSTNNSDGLEPWEIHARCYITTETVTSRVGAQS